MRRAKTTHDTHPSQSTTYIRCRRDGIQTLEMSDNTAVAKFPTFHAGGGGVKTEADLYDEVNRLALRRPVEPLHLEALGVQPAQEAQRSHLLDDV